MFKNKYFKLGSISTMAIGLSVGGSVAFVSCGHKHKATFGTFGTFQTAALKENVANIVKNAKVKASSWVGFKDDDFTKQGLPTIEGHKITIKIYAKSNWTIASFSITAPANNVYRVGDWECSNQPALVPNGTWEQFKTLALAETPTNLLSTVKKVPNYKKNFKWDGDANINAWAENAIPEFDVYGGSGTTGDPLDVMHGQPLIDQSKQTVTAIISIKDSTKEGLYDADPIKAVIRYTNNVNYHVSDWIFTPIVQSQSFIKYKSIFETEIAVAKAVSKDTFDSFGSHNWLGNLSQMPNGHNSVSLITHNDHSTTATDFLSGAGFFSVIDDRRFNRVDDFTTIQGGLISAIVFDIITGVGEKDGQFRLVFTFKFVDDNHHIGMAFNYLFPKAHALYFTN